MSLLVSSLNYVKGSKWKRGMHYFNQKWSWGGFGNENFQLLCEENGILHNFSTQRIPQQNQVVERKNISLKENSQEHAQW